MHKPIGLSWVSISSLDLPSSQMSPAKPQHKARITQYIELALLRKLNAEFILRNMAVRGIGIEFVAQFDEQIFVIRDENTVGICRQVDLAGFNERCSGASEIDKIEQCFRRRMYERHNMEHRYGQEYPTDIHLQTV